MRVCVSPHLRARDDQRPVEDHAREVVRVAEDRPESDHPAHAVANDVERQVRMVLLDSQKSETGTHTLLSPHLH